MREFVPLPDVQRHSTGEVVLLCVFHELDPDAVSTEAITVMYNMAVCPYHMNNMIGYLFDSNGEKTHDMDNLIWHATKGRF